MTKTNDAPKPKLERQKPAAPCRMDSADLPTLLAYLEQTCWRLYLAGDLRSQLR